MRILTIFCCVLGGLLGFSAGANFSAQNAIDERNELIEAQRETIDLMKVELAKSCRGVVPYEEGMTLLPGQTAVVEVPLPGATCLNCAAQESTESTAGGRLLTPF